MTSPSGIAQGRARRRRTTTHLQRLGAPAFIACLFAAAGARAEEQVPLALAYTAPPGCPGADRFLGDVAARTPLLRQARQNESAITLTVLVTEIAGGNKGTLHFESTDGSTSVRQVSAADCEQVVSALALMTALALDPNASTAPMQSEQETRPPPPKEAPPPPKEVALPVVVSPPPAEPPTRWRFRVGVALEALTGPSPDALFLVRPSVELGSSSASPWSSALRLSVAYGRRSVDEGPAGVDVTLITGRLEACPLRYRATSSLQLAPCIAVDAGRLEATGTGITPAERVNAPWVAPGALARLEWWIVDALAAEVSGEFFVPLARSRFYVDENTTIHRVPAVAVGATAGLGARFP